MRCIRCNIEMKKMPYSDNALIDFCTCCKGIWLDGGEFEDIANGIKHKINDLVNRSRIERICEMGADKSGILCPRCDKAKLDRYVRDGVEIDTCPVCNGIFFDNIELQEALYNQQPLILKFFNKFQEMISKLKLP